MDYEFVTNLQQSNTGIKMLRAKLFPLIAGFLWQQFILNNQRVWRFDELAERLDEYLYTLRRRYDEDMYPKSAREYLEDWSDKQDYLRKYYIEGDDIPRLELTAPIEKTLGWVDSLQSRSFVGTESRLKTVFDLLRSLVQQSDTDVEQRVKRLTLQKQAIEQQIEATLAGDYPVLDETQIRERFAHLKDTSQALLRDFSEVEQNFYELDQNSRKRIAQQDGHRGAVLSDIFSDSDSIRESDQGRSFTTFWEFLMSLQHQQELDELLLQARELAPVKEWQEAWFLQDLKLNLMEAADKVMSTNRQLAGQLRRFLDDRSRLDNRRISQLIKTCRGQLLALKDSEQTIDAAHWTTLDSIKAPVNAPVRNLFSIPLAISGQQTLENAEGQPDTGALFEQAYVDEAQLARQVRQCLERQAAISLPELLDQFPLQQGIAELVCYVKLASEGDAALVDTDKEQVITMMVGDHLKEVTLPHILFTR